MAVSDSTSEDWGEKEYDPFEWESFRTEAAKICTEVRQAQAMTLVRRGYSRGTRDGLVGAEMGVVRDTTGIAEEGEEGEEASVCVSGGKPIPKMGGERRVGGGCREGGDEKQ